MEGTPIAAKADEGTPIGAPQPPSAAAEASPEVDHEHMVRRRMLGVWNDYWPVVLLVSALIAAVVGPFISDGLDDEHRSESYRLTWTAMAAAFSATTLAFLITLAWDRRQRTIQEVRETAAEEKRKQAQIEAEQEQRGVEAKRRFGAILLELERLKATLERCGDQGQYKYFFPDLPTGTWEAANESLGQISSNYALIADLSIFYEEVDELQWRLRFKANAWVEDAAINPIIDALVTQMLESVDDLLRRVRKQVVEPDVARIHAEVHQPVLARRRQLTGAIRLKAPESAGTPGS
jgi:hypothetical protein